MAKRKKTAVKKTADKAGKKLARAAGAVKAVKKNKTSAKKATKKAAKKARKAPKKAQNKVLKKAPKREKTAKPSATKKADLVAKPPLMAKKDTAKTSRKTAEKAPQAARSREAISAPPVIASAPAKKPIKKRAEKTATEPVAVTQPVNEVHEIAISMPAAPASRSSKANTFYITTAIAYPNGVPHIGHAYEAIATDALARFQRLDGKDVFFLTGTDEHGLKMVQTAEAENLPTIDVATRNAGRFKDMDERLNVSFDRFIRTTEEQHHRSSQEIWRRMAKNGDIYLDSYSGWYSVRDEAYYAEDETVLGEDNVRRGPQGSPVEWVEEKSYFFRLSAYQDRLSNT